MSLASDVLGTPLPQELTFYIRFKPRGVGISGNCALVSAGRWGAGSELSMLTIGAAALRAQCRDGTNSGNAAAAVSLVAETEYRAVTSWACGTSLTTKRAKLNAGTTATDTGFVNVLLPGAFDTLRIGNRSYDNSLPFEGDVYEAAVWTSALSSTDETAVNSGTDPTTVSPGTLLDVWTFSAAASSYTGAVNGVVLTASGLTDVPGTGGTLSGAVTLDSVTAAGTLADAGSSSLTGSVTLADVLAAGTLGTAPGTVTIPGLTNWSGGLQAGVTVPVVTACRLTDGVQTAILVNQLTNGAGDLAITHAALIPGTWYMVTGWNADGSSRFARPVLAV